MEKYKKDSNFISTHFSSLQSPDNNLFTKKKKKRHRKFVWLWLGFTSAWSSLFALIRAWGYGLKKKNHISKFCKMKPKSFLCSGAV